MWALPLDNRISEQDYLALERDADVKHEYVDGHIYAMVGASENHIALTGTLHFLLYAKLRDRPCSVYVSDLRVQVSETHNYLYPDVAVVCGERQFVKDETIATLQNPTTIIEVLSPSTEAYDRGKKFHEYQHINSLQDYVLVSQTEPRIERFSRSNDNTWLLTTADGLNATLALSSLDVSLALSEVYEQVMFSDA